MTARGVTLLEIMITISILLVLTSVVLPLSKHTGKRVQELELRRHLRTMRAAIDEFKRDWSRDGDLLTGPLCVKNRVTCKEVTGATGYPKTLQTLLGVELTGSQAATRETRSMRRYLRQVPLDPMTRATDWGLRCYQDPPDVQSWCGEDVFDVYSKSLESAIDRSRYREW